VGARAVVRYGREIRESDKNKESRRLGKMVCETHREREEETPQEGQKSVLS
jgi:hypothetical protein